uniref:T9SS type A sorting domain-containing protein n=1 Tax=Spirosoma sp. TaxID=1899569 RepID=UPI003B3A829A
TFRVSQTVESCEGPKATLTVTIKPLPAAPGIANLNYCLQTQDQAAQNVAPLTAYGENLRWFNSDGNQYPNAPTPIITQVGTQTYLVDQTYNGCTGPKATIQVTIRTTAAPTVARPLVTYCVNERAVALQATAETGASLRWIDPYDRVLTEAPIPSTLNTSIKPDGDPFYVFQIGQNGCYSERAVTKVIVNALPTLSLISPVTSINLGQRVALQLKFTSIPPFSYTLADGQAGVVNKTDTTLSLLPRSTTTYQVAAVRNSCGVGLPGSPATATITVRVPTVTTSALTATTLCAGTSISVPFTTTGEFNQGNQFRIELVSVADTSKKYAAPTSSTTSPVTSPLPLTLVGGQYYVRVKADNPEIAILGSNSPTQLTVYPKPSATLTGTQNIYEGYPASLTIALGGESPWTVTYADSVQSYSATATATPYTPEVRPTRTTIYRLVSVANACGTGTISGTATVTVLPLLAVEDDPLGPLVKTFPIPTTSVITVELNLPLTRNPATLSLTDLSGKPIIQQTSKNQKQELDLTAQPNGLYLLRIQVGDKQTVRKVIKQ